MQSGCFFTHDVFKTISFYVSVTLLIWHQCKACLYSSLVCMGDKLALDLPPFAVESDAVYVVPAENNIFNEIPFYKRSL